MIFACGHSVCSWCLSSFLQSHQSSFKCPEDNTTIMLSQNGIEDFPINMVLLNLITGNGIKDSVLVGNEISEDLLIQSTLGQA